MAMFSQYDSLCLENMCQHKPLFLIFTLSDLFCLFCLGNEKEVSSKKKHCLISGLRLGSSWPLVPVSPWPSTTFIFSEAYILNPSIPYCFLRKLPIFVYKSFNIINFLPILISLTLPSSYTLCHLLTLSFKKIHVPYSYQIFSILFCSMLSVHYFFSVVLHMPKYLQVELHFHQHFHPSLISYNLSYMHYIYGCHIFIFIVFFLASYFLNITWKLFPGYIYNFSLFFF